MSRPALSASRAIDIIDLLTAQLDRNLTLTEIARSTGINTSSCHSVLNALVDRGYLSRSEGDRFYKLGPLLTAVGRAAQRNQPLVAKASDAAYELFGEFGIPVMLNTVIGDELVALVSIADASGKGPGIGVAERRPFVAPLGAPLVAWSSEDAIDAWINRNSLPKDPKLVEEWRHILELIRRRGYQVTLRSSKIAELATSLPYLASTSSAGDYKNEVFAMFKTLSDDLVQPDTIRSDKLYDIAAISAPLFDRNGDAVLSLGLSNFTRKLSGAAITQYASRLLHICLEVMQSERE